MLVVAFIGVIPPNHEVLAFQIQLLPSHFVDVGKINLYEWDIFNVLGLVQFCHMVIPLVIVNACENEVITLPKGYFVSNLSMVC